MIFRPSQADNYLGLTPNLRKQHAFIFLTIFINFWKLELWIERLGIVIKLKWY